MKLFHRLTVALTEDDLKLLEDLREESKESYSEIFRKSLDLYYRIYKGFKAAGYEFNKLPKDVERLAYHIYNVELRQYVIMDKEVYRMLLKKIQQKYSAEELEKDPEFINAIKGFANLFYIWNRWNENTKASEKAEEVLRTIEFAGGGEFKKVSNNEFIFRTVPENVVVTKAIIKTVYELLSVASEMRISDERIFIKIFD